MNFNPVPSSNVAYKQNCKITSKVLEDKAFQPEEIQLIKVHLWDRFHRLDYDINGYAILLSLETGVREAEIPSLKCIIA